MLGKDCSLSQSQSHWAFLGDSSTFAETPPLTVQLRVTSRLSLSQSTVTKRVTSIFMLAEFQAHEWYIRTVRRHMVIIGMTPTLFVSAAQSYKFPDTIPTIQSQLASMDYYSSSA